MRTAYHFESKEPALGVKLNDKSYESLEPKATVVEIELLTPFVCASSSTYVSEPFAVSRPSTPLFF